MQAYTYNIAQELPRYETRITIKEIGSDGDTKIVHQIIKPPVFFVSNRSVFLGYYHVHTADDLEYTFIQSSMGNQEYIEKNI